MIEEDDPVLKGALDAIKGRDDEHGGGENTFANIARYWETYLYAEYGIQWRLEEKDVAMMLMLMKAGRSHDGEHNTDDYRDLAGYAAFANQFGTPNDG